MPTLLFINACVRGESSRTLSLSQRLIAHLQEKREGNDAFKVREINLSNIALEPFSYAELEKRDSLLASGDVDDPMFDYAKALKSADAIVIGAPYWDMSFPASLKLFLERTSVVGITFSYADNGTPVGLCHADDLYYVTTSGGYIGEANFGFDYVDALSGLYGIKRTHCISAEGLDIVSANVDEILENANLEA